MNDELLVVNFAALDAASSDISHALGELESQLDQLERDAAPLVGQWAGDARLAYDERQAKWRTAANDLSRMLGDIKVAVDASAEDYASTERTNAQLFG
jgi:early secretory antigenic target protein ESAT-6